MGIKNFLIPGIR